MFEVQFGEVPPEIREKLENQLESLILNIYKQGKAKFYDPKGEALTREEIYGIIIAVFKLAGEFRNDSASKKGLSTD